MGKLYSVICEGKAHVPIQKFRQLCGDVYIGNSRVLRSSTRSFLLCNAALRCEDPEISGEIIQGPSLASLYMLDNMGQFFFGRRCYVSPCMFMDKALQLQQDIWKVVREEKMIEHLWLKPPASCNGSQGRSSLAMQLY